MCKKRKLLSWCPMSLSSLVQSFYRNSISVHFSPWRTDIQHMYPISFSCDKIHDKEQLKRWLGLFHFVDCRNELHHGGKGMVEGMKASGHTRLTLRNQRVVRRAPRSTCQKSILFSKTLDPKASATFQTVPAGDQVLKKKNLGEYFTFKHKNLYADCVVI